MMLTPRRGLLALALGAAAWCGAATASAESQPRCVVVDVGAHAAPGPVRAAVESALQAAKRVRPHPDAEVRAALRGAEPASPRLAAARAALDAAGTAYGALNCDVAIEQSERAVALLEAELGARPVRDELQRAFTYLLLCRATRDRAGDGLGAAEAATQLRGLVSMPASAPAAAPREERELDPPPPGVPASVWRRFPPPAPGAFTAALKITSAQEGVQVIVDLRPVGTAPVELRVAPGRHRIVVYRPGFVSWRRAVDLRLPGASFDLEQLAPVPPEPRAGLRAALKALAKQPKAERPAAAARLGRDAGAERVLAIDVFSGRLRAQILDAASGKAQGGSFEAEARALVARPADLTVFLDGGDAAAPAKAPASRPATHTKIGSRWWHWVVGAAVVAALGVAIWQSEKSSDHVTIRVTKP